VNTSPRGATRSLRPLRRVAFLALLAALAMSSMSYDSSLRAAGDEASLATGPATPDDLVIADEDAALPATVAAADTRASIGIPVAGMPSVEQIPTAALAAYQRAAVIIAGADNACGLDWELLAAIGRVESNHGQYGGNRLDASGVSEPGVFGPRLNGEKHTTLVLDTDGGRLDGDTRFDRAVGPMQFIPSTWGIVGVDGEGDGTRNPQDIDDAALAAAVYLCSGTDDLSTAEGLRAAVYRYNHSQSYVDLVLAVKHAYETWISATSGLSDLTTTALGAFGPVDVPGTAVDKPPAGQPYGSGQALGEDAALTQWQETVGTSQPVQDPVAVEPTEPAPTVSAPTDPTPTDPVPTDPTPTDPTPTDPAPTDPTPTDPAPTDPTPTDAASDTEATLVATRDQCVANGVDAADSAALAGCMAGALVLVIDADGTITAATPQGDGVAQDPVQDAAEVDALIAWLGRQSAP
jgi:membrane-bound lytic murein transglycosylase B